MARCPILQEIYDEHATAIFGLAMSVTRCEAESWDILQELFVRIAREPSILDEVRTARPYLLKLARNIALDHARRHAVRNKYHEASALEVETVFETSANPDEELFRRAMEEALAELPVEQRMVLHLKIWEGLTLEEIGSVMEISPNTAASRFRYGMEKLRERLRPLYAEINKPS
jgi:RNA polymerase sigma-70 factor (ECF subfamily)